MSKPSEWSIKALECIGRRSLTADQVEAAIGKPAPGIHTSQRLGNMVAAGYLTPDTSCSPTRFRATGQTYSEERAPSWSAVSRTAQNRKPPRDVWQFAQGAQ